MLLFVYHCNPVLYPNSLHILIVDKGLLGLHLLEVSRVRAGNALRERLDDTAEGFKSNSSMHTPVRPGAHLCSWEPHLQKAAPCYSPAPIPNIALHRSTALRYWKGPTLVSERDAIHMYPV
jgi:hypothetical protein